jgi:uncharacterized protein
MSTTVKRPEAPRPDGTEKARTGTTAFIRRHPVLIFYALAFAISVGGILLILGSEGLFSTGATMPLTGSAALLAGPAVAGLVMTGLVDGRLGLRRLASRLRRWRVGARWYAVALLIGPLVMGATVFALSLASPEFRPDFLTADDKLSTVVTGIVVGLMVGFFEELGWTGFALPRLRLRYGVVTTGLVMGLLWGAWHFPMFAGTTDPTGALPPALVVAVLLFAWLPPYRVLMVWVYDRTESLPMAMLMHVPISVIAVVLTSEATSSLAVVAPALMWGATFWLIVAVAAWANGGSLTRRQDAAAQESTPV